MVNAQQSTNPYTPLDPVDGDLIVLGIGLMYVIVGTEVVSDVTGNVSSFIMELEAYRASSYLRKMRQLDLLQKIPKETVPTPTKQKTAAITR
jgi:hypothetical protein